MTCNELNRFVFADGINVNNTRCFKSSICSVVFTALTQFTNIMQLKFSKKKKKFKKEMAKWKLFDHEERTKEARQKVAYGFK